MSEDPGWFLQEACSWGPEAAQPFQKVGARGVWAGSLGEQGPPGLARLWADTLPAPQTPWSQNANLVAQGGRGPAGYAQWL